MHGADYGVPAVASPLENEASEKIVNNAAKELIAKFCKQCSQAEVSRKSPISLTFKRRWTGIPTTCRQ